MTGKVGKWEVGFLLSRGFHYELRSATQLRSARGDLAGLNPGRGRSVGWVPTFERRFMNSDLSRLDLQNGVLGALEPFQDRSTARPEHDPHSSSVPPQRAPSGWRADSGPREIEVDAQNDGGRFAWLGR